MSTWFDVTVGVLSIAYLICVLTMLALILGNLASRKRMTSWRLIDTFVSYVANVEPSNHVGRKKPPAASKAR